MVAVVATLAWTHDAAATVTVRQRPRGRTPARRIDQVVHIVGTASPVPHRGRGGRQTPAVEQDGLPVALDRVCMPLGDADDQPSCGGSPAQAMSPPSETSTPHPAAAALASAARSAASAFAVAPRSRRTPAGTRTVPRRRLTTTERQPATAGECRDRRPVDNVGEIGDVSELSERLTDRGVHVSLGPARRVQGDTERFEERRTDFDRAATSGVHTFEIRIDSESAARPVDQIDLGSSRLERGVDAGRIRSQHDRAGAERDEVAAAECTHHTRHEPPDTTTVVVVWCSVRCAAVVGGAVGATVGGAIGDAATVPFEAVDGTSLAGGAVGVVTIGAGATVPTGTVAVAAVTDRFPENARSAAMESAPVIARLANAVHAVRLLTLRRPASRRCNL